uniref:Transmembrane protein 176B n=1 Tax=Pipistrellus kuhlii TaxID=59472 RepID=A0A7J7S6M7_PIPKU|nr:transmembrane protein 176B [Pipistrellus kuhlii]
MAQSMVTVNGVNVAYVLSQPTHFNIHIHQESFLTQLLKAGGSLKEFFIGPQETGTPTPRINYGPLARGAIIAGVGTIVHEKQQSILSGWMSGLLTLAGIGTAMAAVVLCVKRIAWESDDLFSSLCDCPASANTTTGYKWQRSYSDWLEDMCKNSMQLLKNLFLGIRILLLAVCALQAIVSLASLGLGLLSLCGQSSQPMGEEESEESEKKLLGENSVLSSPSEKTTPAIVQ